MSFQVTIPASHLFPLPSGSRRIRKRGGSSSSSSTISTKSIEDIIEKLRFQRNRKSTQANYYCVWKSFNDFFLRLDRRPDTWEDRLTLFVGHLIDTDKKSTTIKSYISTIRSVLSDVDVKLNENKSLISSLTRACKINNDKITTRFPIRVSLLKVIVNKIKRIYHNQPYLCSMYRAIIIVGYFGMLRIGEVTQGQHCVKVKDVQIGTNKNKILFILRSSKTHGKGDKPQFIKLKESTSTASTTKSKVTPICPFKAIRSYLAKRPQATNVTEQFFVFSDHKTVQPHHVHKLLKKMLSNARIDPSYYGFHSLRSGRLIDLLELRCLVETIKKLGRWKSNAVFRYLKY